MSKPINVDPLIGNPPTTNHPIKELYCIISRGPDGEGICSTNMNGWNLTAVTSEPKILEKMMAVFQNSEKPPGITCHVCKFELIEEMYQI